MGDEGAGAPLRELMSAILAPQAIYMCTSYLWNQVPLSRLFYAVRYILQASSCLVFETERSFR